METLVKFRDRQEIQAIDLNNIGGFADVAMAHMVADAITTERMFVGLQVTQHSATEIDVAAGRLWDGVTGKRYAHDAAETISLFSYMPVADQKYLVVSVIGQEVDTYQEPRDFLVDLASGQTEPKSVYMTTSRIVAIQITAGLESSTPQKPDAPTSYLTVAHVLLGTSGIMEIEVADNKQLMRLFDVWQQTLSNLKWINEAAPKLASILSDLASLAALVRALQAANSSQGLVMQLAAEVALLRDKVGLPAVYTEYEADNFLVLDESATTDPEYHALVRMGVRFPWAGETEQQLALFNPYDENVKNFSGLILPAHTEVARLSTTGYAGALLLSQYQYQTLTVRECTRTRRRIEYSPTWAWCTNGGSYQQVTEAQVVEGVFEGVVPAGVSLGDSRYRETWAHDTSMPGHEIYKYRDVWIHTWQEKYTVIDSETNAVNGSVNAQTFLNSQNGWLTKIGLQFTSKAAGGDVTLFVMDTINGLPNKDRTLGKATVSASNINIMPTETVFQFTQPVYLQPGRRYALVLVTGGAHSVALVEGTKYSQGTLFYSTDGEYFQGDFTKDLMMTLYYANFLNPRTVVDLSPVSLADGIAVFSILSEIIQPEATSLVLEYQPSGTGEWFAIDGGTTDALLGLPAMCRLRAVFNGSQDVMPCLGLDGSKLRATRPGLSFKHISTVRALGGASDDIKVILRLENWDGTKHNCTVKLKNGATIYTGTVTDELMDDTTIRRTVAFTPNAGVGISTYQIIIEGSTSTALKCYHVAQRMDVAV